MFEGRQDSPKPKEPNTKQIQFVNLYQLSPLEEQNASDRLKATKGTCQMWVHTHHTENEVIPIERRRLQIFNYRQKRNSLIKKTISSNMPIIAYIPFNGHDDDLEKQLEIYSNYYESNLDTATASTIYYVPTFENDSLPCIFDTSRRQNRLSGAPEGGETITNEWNNLARVLHDVGVKKTILSGAFYENPTNKLGGILFGCVNEAQKRLTQRGFKVFVSNVVSPHPDW